MALLSPEQRQAHMERLAAKGEKGPQTTFVIDGKTDPAVLEKIGELIECVTGVGKQIAALEIPSPIDHSDAIDGIAAKIGALKIPAPMDIRNELRQIAQAFSASLKQEKSEQIDYRPLLERIANELRDNTKALKAEKRLTFKDGEIFGVKPVSVN